MVLMAVVDVGDGSIIVRFLNNWFGKSWKSFMAKVRLGILFQKRCSETINIKRGGKMFCISTLFSQHY